MSQAWSWRIEPEGDTRVETVEGIPGTVGRMDDCKPSGRPERLREVLRASRVIRPYRVGSKDFC
jgi:hypothetical protein